MGWLIIGIFIIYGWVEFEALFVVGDAVGGLTAFLGIFVTALIGLGLLRSQLNAVMTKMRAQMLRGETGVTGLAESASLLCGGVLMLLPGYVTDLLGLLCFIPGVRHVIGLFLVRRLAGRMMAWGTKSAFKTFNQAGSQSGFDAGSFAFGGMQGDENQNTQSDQPPLNDDYIDGEYSQKSSFNKDKPS